MKGGVSLIILNGHKASGSFSWYQDNEILIPAYQEATDAGFWKALNGSKDDIIVYDRCGRLSSHVKMPHSNLEKPDTNVWTDIFEADLNRACGQKCESQSTTAKPTTAPPATTMKTTTKATAAQIMKKTTKKAQG